MDIFNPANRTLDRLPPPLRALLDAELAAGNEIMDADYGHPAPPAGLCVKLARPVSTRPRESTPEIHFYERNSSLYSGEFNDAKRFFFIIEPPHSPAEEPENPPSPSRPGVPLPADHLPCVLPEAPQVNAPALVSERTRLRSLLDALETANVYAGLSGTLSEVEQFHPPEVVDGLLKGALLREGEVAVHFAAMLLFIHGNADEPFDRAQRSFFLRFNTVKRNERVAVFTELCAQLGVDVQRYLALPER